MNFKKKYIINKNHFLKFLFFILAPSFGFLNSSKIKANDFLQNKTNECKSTKNFSNYADLLNKIKNNEDFFIKLKRNNKIEEISFNEYIIGATAAEIGLDAPIEAIKAQMVACASYAISNKGINKEYIEGEIFQCYMPKDRRIKTYGEEKENMMQELVKENFTKTLLVYNDKEVMSCVFACCFPGFSRGNHEAWHDNCEKLQKGYLQSVYSPELDFYDEISKMDENNKNKFFSNYNKNDAKIIKKYLNSVRTTFKFKLQDVFEKIKNKNPQAKMPSNVNDAIKVISRFDSGYVREVQAFGITFKGGDLRRILNLKSSHFNVSINGEDAVFECLGHGHGVGMSQVGAIVYALKGLKWDEILKHYYSTKNNSGKISLCLLKDLNPSLLIK